MVDDRALKEALRKRRLLFLETSGVVSNNSCNTGLLPPVGAVNAMNTLLGNLDPGIVLIGAERIGKRASELQEMLRRWGLTKARVVGLTPRLVAPAELPERRAREIIKWFYLNDRIPILEQPFVIISSFRLSAYMDLQIQPRQGLFSGSDVNDVKVLFGATEERILERVKQGAAMEEVVGGVGI